MAQLERTRRSFETSGTPREQISPRSPTFEQLLRAEPPSAWSPSTSPTVGRNHDQEEETDHHSKKSVLTKVKEKAKKLRSTLSGKKKSGNDENSSPTWGIKLEENEGQDEDPEYLGAPMYESEMAPEKYKETARQHPREISVVSEKHVLTGSDKPECDHLETDKPAEVNKPITETVSETLAPAYAVVSDATQTIASKIAELSVASPEGQETGYQNQKEQLGKSLEDRHPATSSPHKWDKGVSVKEYFMHKFEPGDDERALSQVISEAISPRRAPGDTGVVEKVREAVTSLFRPEESYNSTSKSTTSAPSDPVSSNSNLVSQRPQTSALSKPSSIPISTSENPSPIIPISTNVHEVVEEQSHGRILQPN